MPDTWVPSERLQALAKMACYDDLTPEEGSELEAFLGDRRACRWYRDFCLFHTELRFLARAARADEAAHEQIRRNAAQQASPSSRPSESTAAPLPLPVVLGTPVSGPQNTFLTGWPIAYLVATAIFGVGLLIGAIVHVSQPDKYVGPSDTVHPLNRQSPFVDRSTAIARITGTLDSVWEGNGDSGYDSGAANQKSEVINHKSPLHLGDRLALKSGLLEITYNTGARVILQGPVTYEVESSSSGYLAIGKLTAKLEQKSEVRGQRPESANQKSEIRTQNSFAVRTPTALVTDLGTEFGVEVDRKGQTTSYVFRGAVEVQPTSGNAGFSPVRLVEKESLRVEKSADGKLEAKHRNQADPSAFIRTDRAAELIGEGQQKSVRRWIAYGERLRLDPALVAHYTCERPADNRAVLENVSSAGHALDGRIDGAEWVSGRLPGKLALYFHGPGSGDKVVLPEQQRFKFAGPFTLAVWFRVARFSAMYQPLLTKGGDSWRLERHEDTNALTFDNHFTPDPASGHPWNITDGQTSVNDLRWHLAVAVYEPVGGAAKKRLYIDGRLDAETTSPLSLRQNDDPVWIGSHSVTANCEFQGQIDEIAILARAFSAHEAAEMFKAGGLNRTTGNENLRGRR